MDKKWLQKLLSAACALALALTLTPPALADATLGYGDVPESHWAYNDVITCDMVGVIGGYDDGTFRPDELVTDVQFIVMLTRAFYNEEVYAASETETSSWYAPNLKAASELRISMLQGLTIENKAMNRYDMAMALYNVICNENKYQGVTQDEKDNAKAAMKDWDSIPVERSAAVPCCYALGIITGMSDGCFHGEQTMTRAQACAVIVRLMNLVNG